MTTRRAANLRRSWLVVVVELCAVAVSSCSSPHHPSGLALVSCPGQVPGGTPLLEASESPPYQKANLAIGHDVTMQVAPQQSGLRVSAPFDGGVHAVCVVSTQRDVSDLRVTVRGEKNASIVLSVIGGGGGPTAQIFDFVCLRVGSGSVVPAGSLEQVCHQSRPG